MSEHEHKPLFAGARINTLEELDEAAKARRAVICMGNPCFGAPKPAAIAIHQQGPQILAAFRRGLYYYETPRRKKGGPRFHKRREATDASD